ncbi:hypothetical protein AAFC00_002784 [Neodothiora populina]|uniref:PH domain-containing protein n=1 Tax=Neodothiora populina TaxID=2781224 RepID=A0ABR3P878_9PEZI
MAAAVGKYAAGKFMSKRAKDEQANRLEDDRDPYWYLETDKHGRTKKKPKKSAKHYPAYIPLEDRERLNSFRKYAKMMDTALFGQVGMSFFIGLVPVAGDFADGGIAWLLVQKYANTISCGLPKTVYARMMSNITVDIALGMVPVLGDIADAVFKANVKNLVILEDYLKKFFAPKAAGAQAGVATAAAGQVPMAQIGRDERMLRQQPGVQPERQQPEGRGGFFGMGRDRARDVEMGGQRAAAPVASDSRPHRNDEFQETGTVYGGGRR